MAVLALASGLAVSFSSAAGDGGINIKGGTPVTASQLKANQDVPPTKYTIRNTNGTKFSFTRAGTSIAELTQLAGLDPNQIGYLTFPRSDGTTSYLSHDDIFDPHFKDGLQAIVTPDSGLIRYVRPQRNSQDANAPDGFSTDSASPSLGVGLGKGNVLAVKVKASDSTPRKGDTVTLTASTKGSLLPGESVNYKWNFGDHKTGTGSPVTHTYAKKLSGGARVTATAVGSEGSGGQGSTLLKIGDPKPSDHNSTGPTGPTGPTGANGQNGGSGQNNGSGNGASNNAATGTGTGTTDSGTSTDGLPPSYNYGDIPSFGTPDYNYGSPNYGVPGTTPGTSTPSPNNSAQAPPGAKDPTQQAPSLTPGLETVSGTLVTNLSAAGGAAATRSDSAASSASDSSSPSVVDFNDPSDPKNLTLPLTAVGVVLLFVLGAGREQLKSRRRAL